MAKVYENLFAEGDVLNGTARANAGLTHVCHSPSDTASVAADGAFQPAG